MQHYTTIEQSKKLVELGLNPDTADMSYSYDFDDSRYIITMTPAKSWIVPKYAECIENPQVLPCWSLGALLKLLREYNDCNKLDIFSNRSQKWQITISYYDVVWKEHEEVSINLLEASYSMIVWLLENEYIKTEKEIS